jgi:hypothetical protein
MWKIKIESKIESKNRVKSESNRVKSSQIESNRADCDSKSESTQLSASVDDVCSLAPENLNYVQLWNDMTSYIRVRVE